MLIIRQWGLNQTYRFDTLASIKGTARQNKRGQITVRPIAT